MNTRLPPSELSGLFAPNARRCGDRAGALALQALANEAIDSGFPVTRVTAPIAELNIDRDRRWHEKARQAAAYRHRRKRSTGS